MSGWPWSCDEGTLTRHEGFKGARIPFSVPDLCLLHLFTESQIHRQRQHCRSITKSESIIALYPDPSCISDNSWKACVYGSCKVLMHAVIYKHMPTVHMRFLTHTLYTLNPLSDELPFPPLHLLFNFFFIIIFSCHFLSIIFLHLLIISPYYLSSTISSSPDLLSKLVRPLECRCLDAEAPIPSTSQVQRHPVNFFTGAGRKFQGAHVQKHTLILALSCLHTILHLSFFFAFTSFSSYFFGHSSPSPPLTLSYSSTYFFSSLSPSLLSCLRVKFSRCT